jgi:hypothetical protein
LRGVKEVNPSNPSLGSRRKQEATPLWRKTVHNGESWGVIDLDSTVLFVQIVGGRIYAHGSEAVCKYCGGPLEIRAHQVFCGGSCGVYQGNFSYDLNAYLQWGGAKSFTLRKVLAELEGLTLEERDLEPIYYAPMWSSLYQYEDDPEEEEEDPE